MKKKILSVILMCGLCVGITACGEKNDVVLSDKSNQPTATEVVTDGETIDLEGSVNSEIENDDKNANKTEEKSDKKAETVSKSVETDIDSGMMEFRSENGYSVVYPKKYTVVPQSEEIDFMITDEQSGSSVNISTINGDSDMLFYVEKEGYEMMMQTQDMDITLDLYEVTQINGIDTLKIRYVYDGTEFNQMFFRIDENRTHCLTYAKTNTVASDVASELEHIGETLKNTL